MKTKEKIRILEKLIERSNTVKIEKSDDPDFKNWKNLVERTLIKVYGKDSVEFEHFTKLRFFYRAMIYTSNSDYTSDHLQCFRRDFKLLIDSINTYIEELKEEDIEKVDDGANESLSNEISKIFISHSSKDSEVVEEIIEILETIGVESNQIFCTSFEGYGIGLGEDFLNAIKTELSSDVLVLFVLSNNFYESPVCMCEMGASWVLSKEHIPIIVPPLSYENIKGVIPLTQGMLLLDSLKWNSFKERIEEIFNIRNPLSFSTWERKRDRICNRLENVLKD
ncbi:TIR domain-containing protein [Cellulosilyticum sp. I15G10I2]|uniref:TIR domain-containing protein n=1 Tax=Cellulosilyticum sp. I15G10I2 TaxID=1892843 RepID=UPI00085C7961|nr:TIR domain-containing protein [Cellulosilyticum sp. I15G10I2]